jgi:hypothetical protein
VRSKVDLANAVILNDLKWFALCEYATVVNDGGVVTDVECLPYIVVSDQYTNSFVSQEANDALYLDHCDGVHASKRLIEQNKSRAVCEGPRDLYSASLPAGERLS